MAQERQQAPPVTMRSCAGFEVPTPTASEQSPSGPPTSTTERTLRRRVTNRDVQKHLPLVHRVVAQFMRRLPANIDRGDLMSAGMYGLVTSLERNGGDEGKAFEGYARTRIRGAILDELRAQDWLSRRTRTAVNEQNGTYTGPTTLVGLDDVSESEREATDPTIPDAHTLLETMGNKQVLQIALSRLPERERQIVAMHYFEDRLFKDIAIYLGVSEPRVSQLHARALERLRELLAEAA